MLLKIPLNWLKNIFIDQFYDWLLNFQARISDCFMKNTDRYLNEDALRYLGMKVLNLDSADDLDTKPGMPQSSYHC